MRPNGYDGRMGGRFTPSSPGSLLDIDPDLGEALDDERRERARRHLLVRVVRATAGDWRPESDAFGSDGGLGLLVVDGFAVRRVRLAHRVAAELLGPGEIMRPWQQAGAHAHYPFSAMFQLLGPVTLAVLDLGFLTRAAAYPEVISALFGRTVERARSLAGSLALAQLPAVEDRVLVQLWHLADRFGRVRADGVVLPLKLSHELLGALVGARRPSVTSALGRLADRGLVMPERVGWLLHGDPPRQLNPMRGRGVLTRVMVDDDDDAADAGAEPLLGAGAG